VAIEPAGPVSSPGRPLALSKSARADCSVEATMYGRTRAQRAAADSPSTASMTSPTAKPSRFAATGSA
jgi:hypothetical protein